MRGGGKSGHAVGRALIAEARRRLVRDHLPRIERALRALPGRDVWARPNGASNAVGNLLLHLAGNVRQWIVHGVGGARDVRDRPAEFAARGGPGKAALLGRLRAAVRAADRTLARLDPARLLEPRTIQGYRVNVLYAVVHVVEHFAGHAGQIVYAVKARTGRDLKIYRPRRPTARGSRALPR